MLTSLPPRQLLLDLLEYRDGTLVWKPRAWATATWNARYAWKPAGCLRSRACPKRGLTRYVHVKIEGRNYFAHRVIYKMLTGIEPGMIDHIDGDGTNNRIENLRQVTLSQNQQNRKSSNPLGKGVYSHRRKFGARICKDGREVFIGLFQTPDEARAAYAAEARRLFGDYARA